MDIGDPIKTTVEEIRKVLNIENVVGNTIETDDKILVPITRMGMGFGAGKAETNGNDNTGGAGAGGAAGIEPVAMVVIFKNVDGPEGVKVMSLKNPDPLSRAIGEVSNAALEIMGQGSKILKEKTNKKADIDIEDSKDKTKIEIEDE